VIYGRDVDAVKENLKKIVLEKTECMNQPEKTNVPQIRSFCPGGSYAPEYTV
jgi:hypothetical protein